ncbi:DNA-directed RNA polymerase [Aestuariivirga sp.]|uniref:DNA-directed RNA polymerase n=1 Tax=Aestuariivirga sp. TaxID=2650926 RepID=UPI0039E42A51
MTDTHTTISPTAMFPKNRKVFSQGVVRPRAGIDPTTDPLWDRQVAMEQYMVQRGAEVFRARMKEATDKGNLTMLRPYQRLHKTWMEPMVGGIKAYLERKARGPVPQALLALREAKMDEATLAALTLTAVLDRMVGHTGIGLAELSETLGTTIDHERRLRWWRDQAPEVFGSLQEWLGRTGATSNHIRRVNINQCNKWLEANNQHLPEWTRELRRFVGLAMIDIVVRMTKQFEVLPDPSGKSSKNKSAMLLLMPSASFREWIAEAVEVEEIIRPQYLPTLIRPKPWTHPKSGGYWTPFVRSPWMISFKAANEHNKGRAIDEMVAYDMPNVYRALNLIQDTAWVVNKPILDVVRHFWEADTGVAGLPKREAKRLPPKPDDFETNEDARRQWKREARDVYGDNARLFSRTITAKRCIDIAELLKNEARFFFPHLLDFRGRAYPIPSALQPQGTDLARGLLTFETATPVSSQDGSHYWLMIHAANTFGNDKWTFDERVAWTEENKETIIGIADDPITNRAWVDADKPWQFLAACKEMARWWREGDGMLSSLPIHVDGTCNGIQHLASMVRDETAGRLVNLVPCDEPQDIYDAAAKTLQPMLEELAEAGSGEAKLWLRLVDGKVPRSLTKRPVMILPYGGTRQAYAKYIREWIKETDPDHKLVPIEKRGETARWLVPLMWNAVMQHTGRAQEVMEWLKKCARVSFAEEMPLTWITPVGFIVRHFYGTEEHQRIRISIDGKSYQIAFVERTPKPAKRDILSGISPNFVHSMDASMMLITVLMAEQSGITSLALIHDSFGTTAGNMHRLGQIIREAFLENYKTCSLDDFAATVNRFVGVEPGTKEACPPKPQFGTLSLEQVIDADYFFA